MSGRTLDYSLTEDELALLHKLSPGQTSSTWPALNASGPFCILLGLILLAGASGMMTGPEARNALYLGSATIAVTLAWTYWLAHRQSRASIRDIASGDYYGGKCHLAWDDEAVTFSWPHAATIWRYTAIADLRDDTHLLCLWSKGHHVCIPVPYRAFANDEARLEFICALRSRIAASAAGTSSTASIEAS